jgi:hypothetical protein
MTTSETKICENGNYKEEKTMITEDTIDLSALNLDDFDDDN